MLLGVRAGCPAVGCPARTATVSGRSDCPDLPACRCWARTDCPLAHRTDCGSAHSVHPVARSAGSGPRARHMACSADCSVSGTAVRTVVRSAHPAVGASGCASSPAGMSARTHHIVVPGGTVPVCGSRPPKSSRSSRLARWRNRKPASARRSAVRLQVRQVPCSNLRCSRQCWRRYGARRSLRSGPACR